MEWKTRRMLIILFSVFLGIWGVLIFLDAIVSNWTGYVLGIVIVIMVVFGIIGAINSNHGFLRIYFILCIVLLIIIALNFLFFAINVSAICNAVVVGGCLTREGWVGTAFTVVTLVVLIWLTKKTKDHYEEI